MRYLVNTSSGKLRKIFRTGLVYDERIIRKEIAKQGMKLVRPNGDSRRTRGSRRLAAKDGTETLALFQAEIKEEGPMYPVPVGFV